MSCVTVRGPCHCILLLYACKVSERFTLTILKEILLLFLGPTNTKPQAEILKLNNVNGCNDISFGAHSILEGDRIPPMKSHGQALEEELCFPGVLSDNRDTPANLLRHFYGCLMPCTCCLDGRRTEDVGAGQTGVFVRLALCCSVSCCTCFVTVLQCCYY